MLPVTPVRPSLSLLFVGTISWHDLVISLSFCRAGLGVAHVGCVYLPGLLAPSPEHPPHQPGQVRPGHVGCQSGGGRPSMAHIARITVARQPLESRPPQVFPEAPLLFPPKQHHFGSLLRGFNAEKRCLANIYLIVSEVDYCRSSGRVRYMWLCNFNSQRIQKVLQDFLIHCFVLLSFPFCVFFHTEASCAPAKKFSLK